MLAAIKSTCDRNKEFEVIKADDQFALQLIKKYGDVASNLYRNLPIPAARSDLARLLLLKEYGGIYLDAAIEVSINLDSLYLAKDNLLTLAVDDRQKNLSLTHVCNGVLGSIQNCDLIEELIDLIINTLCAKRYNHEVWYSTGPFLLNLLLRKYDRIDVCRLRGSEFRGSKFQWRSVSGISNSWVQRQKDGVVSEQFYAEFGTGDGLLIDALYKNLLKNESAMKNPWLCNQLAHRFIVEGKMGLAAETLQKAILSLGNYEGNTSALESDIKARLAMANSALSQQTAVI